MSPRVLVLFLILSVPVFAGCTQESATSPTGPPTVDEEETADPGRIEGVVESAEGPVADASVSIRRLGVGTTTGADGSFVLAEVEPGSYALQVDAEHHHRAYEDLVVTSGDTTRVEVLLDLVRLAPNVPARDGFVETPVVAKDTVVVSAGDQAPRVVVTNGTAPDPDDQTARPGWWTVPPHDEGHAAYFVVTLSWNASATPVALRVTHGDPEDQPLDGANGTVAPMAPDPEIDAETFRHYRFASPDVASLGKRPWHFGVYATPDDPTLPVPASRFVDHTIVVQVVYLVDAAVEASTA